MLSASDTKAVCSVKQLVGLAKCWPKGPRFFGIKWEEETEHEEQLRRALSILAIAFFSAGAVYADTFEYLTYTAPRGWVKWSNRLVDYA